MCPTRLTESPERVQLQANIAGYRGYESKNERAETDRLLRSHLQSDLQAILNRIENPPQFADDELQKAVAKSCASVRRKLNLLSSSLREPAEETDSFFNRDHLPDALLQRLYQHEISMLNSVSLVSMEISSVPEQTEMEQLSDQFSHIQDLIDTFNQGLFEREALIAEYSV
ncbi:hypothetical protein JW992_05250 [candidate division KSB1 bacterium]|nr:hypothetical protein [candidate division KSB1 bacterium]